MQTVQAWFQAGHGVAVAEGKLEDPGPDEVLIAPGFSYLSAGTELVSLRAYRSAAADERPPAQPGYSQAGTVLAVGDRVEGIAVGDRVAAIGAGAYHASRTVVARNLVVPLPDEVDLAEAATTAMCCFALEAVHKSAARLGQSVIVFGAGMMGQLAARLYRIAGARVAIMDSEPNRLALVPPGIATFTTDDHGWSGLADWSGQYGIEHACVAFGGDATETIERLKPIMSTAPDGVPHGRIVFPGGARATLLMASNLGNLEFLSSAKAGPGYRDPAYESGVDYPAVYVGSPVRRNVETLLELLSLPADDPRRLDLTGLITHRFPITEAPDGYRLVEESPGEAMAVLFSYPDPT